MLCSRRTKEPLGPPVTVFIGNITERAPDGMVRLVLNSCGTVHNWKRVQGASGKLQGESGVSAVWRGEGRGSDTGWNLASGRWWIISWVGARRGG